MRYTAEEVVEYPDEQERQSKWEFFKEILLPIIVKLVLFCFLIQIVIASAIVGTALLIVSLRRRNKKRETQTDGSSSDKT